MNDEWSRCPICFEDYSLIHRPTTFVCGHSTCIDHTIGSQCIHYCPICRHPLRKEDERHVSYNLEEASRLFQLIKNTIDWSTIKLPSPTVINHEENNASAVTKRDEIYARQLQAELNRETANESSRKAQVSTRNQALPIEEIQTNLTVLERNQVRGHQKRCGHRCDLVSTRQCCLCSDRRPHNQGNMYAAYVDGRGMINRVTRDEYYCTTCKRR
ncbi:unnamed protein product [Rotaria sp. Silwood2]|nr:unnamed protein product [Rotaria sp. Silwood2]CAF2929662.1 unnamed protein product [Rotaria sp. Silwood2]CAF3082977.1 unnamed protein product [Rotaria sp. Silwood2]CAF3908208.1 unnamed protein product [Rotaria sp. Silwood2]CAF3908595.1 unnamed protein product [Rotaria sp. Silwood2]